MTAAHPGRLLVATAALALAAAAAVWCGGRAPSDGAAFQRLVRGVGTGPAVGFEPCATRLDPRVAPVCPHDLGPLPGGAFCCPDHAR